MKNTLRGWAALFVFAAAVFALPASAAETAPKSSDTFPAYLVSSWEKLSGTLTNVLELEDKRETLPDSAWIGADKSSNAKKIDALLDQALEILLAGDANELRKQAIKLRTEIPALKLELDGLRNQRISAPETSKLPWVKTRSKIDDRVAELNQEIGEKEQALAAINARIAESLRAMGLSLDDAQINILLTSVTGDDLLQNTVIFSNVKRVVEKLSELSREDRDNLEINRRYTGMYLVLNDLLIYTQEGLVEKIDTNYKPQLAAIQTEAEKLRVDAAARARQAQYSENQRKSFAANAESNSMTVRVAGLYTELLESQRKSLTNSLQELRRNRDVADSTYRTVRSTGDLRNLIRSGLELFDSIHALSMPEIQPFRNDAIRKEFEEINRRLKR